MAVLSTTRVQQRGQAAVEVALMLPWIVLIFAAIVDFGFFAYAFISVENAARAAALYTSTDPLLAANAGAACQYAQGEAAYLPGVAASCTGATAGTMSVTATLGGALACPPPGPGNPGGGTSPCDSIVTVTYTTRQLFPLPFLPGRFTINRTAQMRIDQ